MKADAEARDDSGRVCALRTEATAMGARIFFSGVYLETGEVASKAVTQNGAAAEVQQKSISSGTLWSSAPHKCRAAVALPCQRRRMP